MQRPRGSKAGICIVRLGFGSSAHVSFKRKIAIFSKLILSSITLILEQPENVNLFRLRCI